MIAKSATSDIELGSHIELDLLVCSDLVYFHYQKLYLG